MKNEDWEIPPNLQPDPDDYSFDLQRALGAVVSLKTFIPVDAFTAGTLGTERAGSGVVINDKGLVATIGYLITEAETIWITSDRQARGGRATRWPMTRRPASAWCRRWAGWTAVLELGDSDRLKVGDQVVFAAGGGQAPLDRDAPGGPAGIRRLLGIRAGRRAVHRAGASVLGRRRADRVGRQADGDRLADPAAGRPQGAGGWT